MGGSVAIWYIIYNCIGLEYNVMHDLYVVCGLANGNGRP